MSSDKFAKSILGMVSPTIVLHKGWESECPGWILEKIKMERMVESMKGNEGGKASDLEALAYLHTASLAAPFSETQYKIYRHVFDKTLPDKAGALGLGPVGELNDYEKVELDKLKAWIFKQREKREKERTKKVTEGN